MPIGAAPGEKASLTSSRQLCVCVRGCVCVRVVVCVCAGVCVLAVDLERNFEPSTSTQSSAMSVDISSISEQTETRSLAAAEEESKPNSKAGLGAPPRYDAERGLLRISI